MKRLMTLLALCLLAQSASAVLDPDPNMLGMYLDLNADVVCGPVGEATLYVILTNPAFPEVNGVEFGFDILDGPLFVLFTTWPTPSIAFGGINGTRGDWATGYTEPISTSEATVVCEMQVLPQGPTRIVLGANSLPSASPDLPAVLVDGIVTEVGLSAGVGGVALTLGTPCEDVIRTESTTFDALKGLYR